MTAHLVSVAISHSVFLLGFHGRLRTLRMLLALTVCAHSMRPSLEASGDQLRDVKARTGTPRHRRQRERRSRDWTRGTRRIPRRKGRFDRILNNRIYHIQLLQLTSFEEVKRKSGNSTSAPPHNKNSRVAVQRNAVRYFKSTNLIS